MQNEETPDKNSEEPPLDSSNQAEPSADNGQRSLQASVGLDRIVKAPQVVPNPKGDLQALKEQAALAHEGEQFKRELGWLGVPFGGKREKPGNISALVISLIFALLIVGYVVDAYLHINYPFLDKTSLPFDKLFSGLTSIVTLILGYLFGSNDRSDK